MIVLFAPFDAMRMPAPPKPPMTRPSIVLPLADADDGQTIHTRTHALPAYLDDRGVSESRLARAVDHAPAR